MNKIDQIRFELNTLNQKVAQPDNSDEVASPCIKLCKIDSESKVCGGCYRTIEEIIIWSKASSDQKRKIWANIAARLNSPELHKDAI
jgi:predicted Fe-S protein YdhL (DUF1289 family)